MFLKQKLLGFTAWVLFRLLAMTWRIQVLMPESMRQGLKDKSTLLFAHWHGDELVLFHFIGKYRVATMASTSKDGEIMNTAVRLIGGKTTRGSSTRGGISGLKGLIRLIKTEFRNCSFAVDGPKGPLYEVKPGIFEMSRLLKAPIYPAGVACSKAWKFEKSWNKTFLPKPFSKIIVSWGEPMSPVSSEVDPRSSELAKTLKEALHQCRESAHKNLLA